MLNKIRNFLLFNKYYYDLTTEEQVAIRLLKEQPRTNYWLNKHGVRNKTIQNLTKKGFIIKGIYEDNGVTTLSYGGIQNGNRSDTTD